MYILIATANEQLIQSLYPSKKIEFHKQVDDSGRYRNTCYFKMTKPQFAKLYKTAKTNGYNPFALFVWNSRFWNP